MGVITEPRYTHDCERCIFLGHFQHYDLYFHRESDFWPEDFVLARYGSHWADCTVSIVPTNDHPVLVRELREAVRLSEERGLLNGE